MLFDILNLVMYFTLQLFIIRHFKSHSTLSLPVILMTLDGYFFKFLSPNQMQMCTLHNSFCRVFC